MAVKSVRFGPGTLKLGTTPGVDHSCQVQSCGLNPSKDEGDPIKTLCGDSVAGSITYTWDLAGVILQDYTAADGLVQYTWTNAGQPVAFEFVPSTATTAKWVGTLIVDPLAIGTSDGEFGDVLTSEFEWTVVGTPTPTWPTVELEDVAV